MATTYGFSFSWIATPEDTKKASGVVYQGGGTVFSFRQPSNGAISSSDLTAFAGSVSQNLQKIRSDWRSYIRPILNSLPAGNTDTRWSTALGSGLPAKIDCFTYGVQGSTLFVFNDANATVADGRYWDATGLRPKTIAEKFEDLYQAVSDIETSFAEDTTIDLDPLWAAIGEPYRDGDVVASVGSLDTRTGILETYLSQLNEDIYDPSVYTTYQLGTPLIYSIADMLNALLILHNAAGWGANPSGVNHSAIPAAAHVHPFDEVTPAPAPADTQERVGPYVTLENEVKRLRWEIQQTRGSTSWYSDVNHPAPIGGAASLGAHIGYTGLGTPSTSNPHGTNYVDTGASVPINVMRLFVGMTDLADHQPTYSSTYYVTQHANLEVAIGELDNSLHTALGTAAVRVDYGPYDRSSMSATDRANTPIVVNHTYNRRPVLNIIDETTEGIDYWGMYSSPTYDVEIDYPDSNTFRIWTEAAVVSIIAFF